MKTKIRARILTQAEALERVNTYIAEFCERDVQFILRYRWDLKMFTITARNDANQVKFYFPEFQIIPTTDGAEYYASLDIKYADVIQLSAGANL